MRSLVFPLRARLTLGLAPVFPAPHLVGKLRWISGGATGTTATGDFDLALHGAPLVWWAVASVRAVARPKNA